MESKCPRCGTLNRIVNECMCDPNNMPTFTDPALIFQKINRMASTLAQMASIHHDLYRQGDLVKMHTRQLVLECERILNLAKMAVPNRNYDEGAMEDLAASGGIVGAP
jgi:hypothetical protein